MQAAVSSLGQTTKKRVVILGGGFGGAFAAQALLRSAVRDDLEVLLIDRHNYVLYYPLLVEAAVGVIEPRHVIVPVRKFLGNQGSFLQGEIIALDPEAKHVTVRLPGHPEPRQETYDHVIVALGSVTRIPPLPGLAEHGFQIKSLSDGIGLRDRAIRLLEEANTHPDAEKRKELLTVIVVGANYTGVELAGEYEAFLHTAARSYPNVKREEIQVYLLEFGKRILPSVDERLAAYVTNRLTERGVRVMTDGATVTSIGADSAVLMTGERVPCRTVIWAAGIAPNPLLRTLGLPLNDKGYLRCQTDMRVEGFDNVWGIGDAATILDAHGKPYAATAQNSSRQGPAVAENIRKVLRGDVPTPFRFENLGSFASFGDHEAAANVLGVDLKGFLGWLVYRGAYLSKFPTFRLKFRLLLDWVEDFLLPYPPVQLGLHDMQTDMVTPNPDEAHPEN